MINATSITIHASQKSRNVKVARLKFSDNKRLSRGNVYVDICVSQAQEITLVNAEDKMPIRRLKTASAGIG